MAEEKNTKTTKNKSKKTTKSKVESSETKGTQTKPSSKKQTFEMKQVSLKKLIAIVVVVVGLGGFFLLGYINRNQIIVASVNGETITRLALIRELEKQAGKQALDTLITQKLVEQQAQKQGIVIVAADIDQQLETIEQNVASQGVTLEEALAFQGITLEELKEQVRVQLVLERLVADRVVVSDAEVDQYIESNGLSEEDNPDVRTQVREQLIQQRVLSESQVLIQDMIQSSEIKSNLYPDLYAPTL